MTDGSTPHCRLHPTTLAPTVVALASVLMGIALSAPAQAQDAPNAVVLRTQARDENLTSMGRALARVVRSRLGELDTWRVDGTPDLGLEAIQLAVGCMGETSDCLRLVAEQLGVSVLVVPSLDHAGENTVLGLTLYRTDVDPPLATATRQLGGADSDGGVEQAAHAALVELLGDRPEWWSDGPPDSNAGAETHDVLDGAGDDATSGQDEAPASGGLFRYRWGWLTASGGVALLAIGAGLGLASQNNDDSYGSAPTSTRAEVDHALSLYSKAQRQGRAANALFALGGVAVGTGLVGMLLGLRSQPREQARLSVLPVVGPGTLALRVSWNLGGVR